MTDLLHASQISVLYPSRSDGGKEKLALNNVSLRIPEERYTIGIVGESGSGKTTLGMSLMRLIRKPGRITSGRIEYRGSNVLDFSDKELRSYRGPAISMIFQSSMNALNPVKRASDHIVELLQDRSGIAKRESREISEKLLSEVGLDKSHFADFPHQMSGGMRQRVMIALSLALSPKLVIADEPTSALDVVVQKQILALLKREIDERGLSLIYITHDLPILYGLVQEIAVMYAGEIIEQGPSQRIFSSPLHPYTEDLLSSLLTIDTAKEASAQATCSEIRLVTDRLHRSRAGCPYQDRCKYAFSKCRTEKPHLNEVEPGRLVSCHKYSN